VKVFTTHLKEGRAPMLVREGFSVGAFLLGPLWLAAYRAFVPAVLALAAELAAGFLLHGAASAAVELGIAFLLGLSGRDLVRWSLSLHGFHAAHVLAARDTDAALARLLSARPDLAPSFLGKRGL
jgi:hypothetical protein